MIGKIKHEPFEVIRPDYKVVIELLNLFKIVHRHDLQPNLAGLIMK